MSDMMEHPFNLALALPLVFAGGWRLFRVKLDQWRPLEGFARLGYAWTKWLMSRQVHSVFLLCTEAAPEAATGWSACVGIVTFAFTLCLTLMAIVDLLRGIALLSAQPAAKIEIAREPFWAGGFIDFWNRWGACADSHRPTVRSAFLRCGLFLLGVALGGGLHGGLAVWAAVQAGLILLDVWLQRRKGWRNHVPPALKSAVLIALFVLSSVFLYPAGLEASLKHLSLLFAPPAETMYSLFLDARLTSPYVLTLLWVAALTVLILPRLDWWMERSRYLRWLALTVAVFPWILFTMLRTGASSFFPGRKVEFWCPTDTYGVVAGQNGWLYPVVELDRLTLKREDPSLMEKNILQVQAQLQATGAHLLVIPVPGKINLRPEPILPAKYKGAVYPPGYHDALKRLQAAGVDVLDMTDKLWDQRNITPFYFQQDSHWRWEAMKEFTVQVSRHIRTKYPQVIKDETPLVDAVFMERQDVGDLAKGISSRLVEVIWKTESTPMVGLRGLSVDASTPVLVVGDDLIRVYDSQSLSFRPASETDAPTGFPTQLGALLGRGLEVGDTRYLDEIEKQLAGKKLVIWVMRAGNL